MKTHTIEDAERILKEAGYVTKKIVRVPEEHKQKIKTPHLYAPYVSDWEMFLPYIHDEDINKLLELLRSGRMSTLVSLDRLWILKSLLLQTSSLPGEIWETGCFQGGTALFFKMLLEKYSSSVHTLRLFDTFAGMPAASDLHDFHRKGDFGNTSLEAVRNLVGNEDWIDYREGFIPDTFDGLDGKLIRFAHIDLDIYQSIMDATSFIYSRVCKGGVIIYDDYGFFTCPGAREAVDTFYSNKQEFPLVLPTGQAIVIKI